MQVVIYIMGRPGKGSLRKQIADDISKWDHDDGLDVVSKQTKGRPQGWSKITKKDAPGALNIEWDAASSTLLARAVTKKGNKPDELVGTFISYLLRVHGSRISAITMRTIG